MEVTQELIDAMAKYIRVKSQVAQDEISDLVAACVKEMEKAGVYIDDASDPLARQAIKLYCKGHYGYDESGERFLTAYASLRDAMALSGDYSNGGLPDDG